MFLRNKDTKEEFHAPSGIGKALIATGTVEEVLPEPKPAVEVKWHVQRGRYISDYEAPPLICWSADGNKGYCESTKGTAHLNAKVFIPGQKPVTCPSHIAEEYLRLFAEWSAKSKRRKPATETVSAHTPKVNGVSPYQGATTSPWRQDLELRNK
ncbi:MAG TPA: hypothetical protein VN025_05910 [Candidatus Dormibacteraeota bacterium]|jgi:hypothetical protein|nr:hypothetical protein [Candidatus Dormibacteraeota bacterium]